MQEKLQSYIFVGLLFGAERRGVEGNQGNHALRIILLNLLHIFSASESS